MAQTVSASRWRVHVAARSGTGRGRMLKRKPAMLARRRRASSMAQTVWTDGLRWNLPISCRASVRVSCAKGGQRCGTICLRRAISQEKCQDGISRSTRPDCKTGLWQASATGQVRFLQFADPQKHMVRIALPVGQEQRLVQGIETGCRGFEPDDRAEIGVWQFARRQ